MNSFGLKLRKLREEKGLPLRVVASFLEMDQAILSKIETGKRKCARAQVLALSGYFGVPENELLVAWLCDKVLYEISGDDALAQQVLQVAEEQLAYQTFQKTDKKGLLQKVKTVIKRFAAIEKAWIYGSFARGDDGPKSDIDIALQASESFNYFDLAEVQHELEKLISRKIDIGFIDSFKPYIFDHVKPDLKLIYEK